MSKMQRNGPKLLFSGVPVQPGNSGSALVDERGAAGERE